MKGVNRANQSSGICGTDMLEAQMRYCELDLLSSSRLSRVPS